MEYASKGVAGAGLGLGIAGTALGLMNGNGILGGLTGGAGVGDMANVIRTVADVSGMNRCSDNTPVTRYELQMAQALSAKDSEIALLKSEQNTEVKIADVYERIMTRVNADQRAQADWNAAQMVNNAQMSASIATNANSIHALRHVVDDITKIVVPADAICPKPMPEFNSWTAPT